MFLVFAIWPQQIAQFDGTSGCHPYQFNTGWNLHVFVHKIPTVHSFITAPHGEKPLVEFNVNQEKWTNLAVVILVEVLDHLGSQGKESAS